MNQSTQFNVASCTLAKPCPVWDETFPSDQETLFFALDEIKTAGGIQAFSELSDLEAKNNIFPESLTRH
ncbi:hypothetical protein [Acinetobacter sp. TTH0-4]|uniref:hypothetical protein n=1 Tax=Acinetobacter sp. TTH0-4 TaxID=1646498 RepID=UPI0009D63F8E|nr:hypothetical protein [Acinetobacter sp. TTH0-4]